MSELQIRVGREMRNRKIKRAALMLVRGLVDNTQSHEVIGGERVKVG